MRPPERGGQGNEFVSERTELGALSGTLGMMYVFVSS